MGAADCRPPPFGKKRGGRTPYIDKEKIFIAKQMTAIEFLRRYRPEELVRCGAGEYELRSHDSFKINESSSVWHWKSRDIGGKTALDYLIHVEKVPFLDAVQYLLNQEAPTYIPTILKPERRPFVLPPSAPDVCKVASYLRERGISLDVISYCVSRGILYESIPYHNCVFVGLNAEGVPRYAALRSTFDGPNVFKQDKAGSDKRYCFCIPPIVCTNRVAIYEAASDAMAHMTLEGNRANKFRLSMGGIYAPVDEREERPFKRPVALEEFLRRHPEVDELEICTDNDPAGRWAARHIAQAYADRCRIIENLPQQEGCDYADLAKQVKRSHKAAFIEDQLR